MSAKLTAEERKLLFPIDRKCDLEQAIFRFTRFLRHNRRLIVSQERHIIMDLAEEWRTEAQKVFIQRPIDLGDTVDLIAENWTSARWPIGFNPIDAAVTLAAEYPNIPPRPDSTLLGDCNYHVMRVVYNLNVAALRNGDTSYYVSSVDLSKRLGYYQTSVFRALRRLEKQGKITVSKRGDKQGKATSYLAAFWS